MSTVKVVAKVDKDAVYGLMDDPKAQALLEKCAGFALAAQETTVPIDTGNLHEHLKIGSANNGRSRRIGVLPEDPVDYVLPVELGHRTEAGTWVPAQPFIRPSIDAAKRGLK